MRYRLIASPLSESIRFLELKTIKWRDWITTIFFFRQTIYRKAKITLLSRRLLLGQQFPLGNLIHGQLLCHSLETFLKTMGRREKRRPAAWFIKKLQSFQFPFCCAATSFYELLQVQQFCNLRIFTMYVGGFFGPGIGTFLTTFMLRHKKNLHFWLAYFQAAFPFSYWKWDSENLKKEEKISLSRPQSFPYKLWHFIKKRQWHYGNDPIEKRRKPPPSLTSTSMGHHYIWKPMFTINYPWECLLFYLLLLEFWDAKAALVIFHLYLDNFLLANPITLEAIQNMIPFFIDLESAPFPPFLLESNMFHRPWKCARICSLYNLIFIYYFHLKTLSLYYTT